MAHSLAVMIVQADGATFVVDQDPDRARKALRTVGVQPGRLARALVVEGAVVGLVAGVLGVVAVQGASRVAVVVARANGTALRFPDVPVGTAIAALAGFLPARRAARVSPVAALAAAG